MLACARLGRRPLGGVRRLRRARAGGADRRLPAEADRLRVVRHRARSRSVEYKPLLDRALELAAHTPERCIILQRPQLEAELVAGRDVDWDEAMAGAEPADLRAGRRRPTRSTSSTRPARRGMPKGIVRDNGGHAVALRLDDGRASTTCGPARSTGRRPTSAGWSATPTSSTRRCCTAARPSCTRASRSARPTPAPSGGCAPSTACSALFTAPTAIRAIKREDPRGELVAGYDLSRAAHAVPGRRALRPRHAALGRAGARACR